jgi:hypothetical protein
LMSPITSNIDLLASQFQLIRLKRTAYHTNLQIMMGEALLTRFTTSVSLRWYRESGLHNNGSVSLLRPKADKNLIRTDTF